MFAIIVLMVNPRERRNKMAVYSVTIITIYGEMICGYAIAYNQFEAIDILIDDLDLNAFIINTAWADLA